MFANCEVRFCVTLVTYICVLGLYLFVISELVLYSVISLLYNSLYMLPTVCILWCNARVEYHTS